MVVRRLLVALLLVAVLGAILVGGGILWAARGGLPQRSGEVRVEGMQAPVEVRWDEWGVPHLDGDGLLDLAAAMGWIHANDRFFQLETGRRRADGRLAELFGDAALPADRHFRRLRFPHLARIYAEALGPESRLLLEAYSRGVNAWLGSRPGDLSPELRALGVEPEPWSPEDSVKFQLLLAHELSFWAGRPEEDRLQILRELGADRLADLVGAPIAGAVPGSNNWALGTERTLSDGPLLASDPHLPLRLPGFWYQARLHADDYRAQGMTLVGFPFVVIGQGPSLAWAFTNTMLDDHDLFLEELDEAGARVRRGDGWEPVRFEDQEIRSRDGGVERIEVRWTDIGPLLPAEPERGLPARSLAWTGLRPGDLPAVFLRLARTRRVEGLVGALESWVAPAQNLLAVDRHGGLLLTVVGRVPERGESDGRLPVDAADRRRRWRGLMPQSANPTVMNPPEGLLVTANNDIRPPGFREPFLPLTADFDTPHRAERIRELLLQRERWDTDGLAAVQIDVVSRYAREVVGLLAGDPPGDAGRALDALRDWDGSMLVRGPSALFAWLERSLLEAALHDETEAAGLPPAAGRAQLLRLLRGRMDPAWWDDVATPEPEARSEIVTRALAESWARVTDAWGESPDAWDYGSLHPLRLRHPLGELPVVGGWFDRGPLPMPGSATTVAAFGGRWSDGTKPVAYGPSMRWIADPTDPDRSRAVLPAGQSGHPGDPHYDDQLDSWLEGRLRPARWSDAAVEEGTVSRMRILPARQAAAAARPPGPAG